MPPALFALMIGAFGIGVTEFVIMGLLIDIANEFKVSIQAAGLLVSGYALGVVVGAPLLTGLTMGWPRRRVLLGLMAIFTLGNIACAIAPSYDFLMAARVLTALAHGTFFGVGSIVAATLVAPQRRASAIAAMFTGLTIANILGVPFGTWLAGYYGWRMTFWSVTAVGGLALFTMAVFLPVEAERPVTSGWQSDLGTMLRAPVLLGLLTTVLGYAGVFTVFTYIAPILTEITGLAKSSVSPILLIFGAGLVAGNIVGGRLADRWLAATMLGSLFALSGVLAIMTLALHSEVAVIAMTGVLGFSTFATVAPLQSWVLEQAKGVVQSVASSLNIAAFNLGNAIGAWIGGLVIAGGWGLGMLPLVAALLPAAAFVIAIIGIRISFSRQFATPGRTLEELAR